MYPSSGTIVLPSGESQVNLYLEILDDSDPELEETFTLILSQPTGGAALDTLAAQSTFIIRYCTTIDERNLQRSECSVDRHKAFCFTYHTPTVHRDLQCMWKFHKHFSTGQMMHHMGDSTSQSHQSSWTRLAFQRSL